MEVGGKTVRGGSPFRTVFFGREIRLLCLLMSIVMPFLGMMELRSVGIVGLTPFVVRGRTWVVNRICCRVLDKGRVCRGAFVNMEMLTTVGTTVQKNLQHTFSAT